MFMTEWFGSAAEGINIETQSTMRSFDEAYDCILSDPLYNKVHRRGHQDEQFDLEIVDLDPAVDSENNGSDSKQYGGTEDSDPESQAHESGSDSPQQSKPPALAIGTRVRFDNVNWTIASTDRYGTILERPAEEVREFVMYPRMVSEKELKSQYQKVTIGDDVLYVQRQTGDVCTVYKLPDGKLVMQQDHRYKSLPTFAIEQAALRTADTNEKQIHVESGDLVLPDAEKLKEIWNDAMSNIPREFGDLDLTKPNQQIVDYLSNYGKSRSADWNDTVSMAFRLRVRGYARGSESLVKLVEQDVKTATCRQFVKEALAELLPGLAAKKTAIGEQNLEVYDALKYFSNTHRGWGDSNKNAFESFLRAYFKGDRAPLKVVSELVESHRTETASAKPPSDVALKVKPPSVPPLSFEDKSEVRGLRQSIVESPDKPLLERISYEIDVCIEMARRRGDTVLENELKEMQKSAAKVENPSEKCDFLIKELNANQRIKGLVKFGGPVASALIIYSELNR